MRPDLWAAFQRLAPGGGYRFQPVPRSATDPCNPRDPHHDGVTHDRWVEGERVLVAAPDRATYCCGLTLELWWDAVEAAGGRVPLGAEAARAFIAEWFCPTMGHPGAVAALVERGWAAPVALADAQPGDVVQFWRSVDLARPSGHSCLFVACSGGVLQYASSQPATGGVGIHAEPMGTAWQIHVARPLALTEV